MAYDAKVLEVMIASPSDVLLERAIVRDIIAEWNAIHSRQRQIVMLPLGWETHSSPELTARPQQLINDRILIHADILVGIFWTRVGTPTEGFASGTVEEIQEHIAAGKPALLYFSGTPVMPDSIDSDQYAELRRFKEWAYEKGMVHSYSTKEQFRDDLRRHLELCLQSNDYLKSVVDVDLVQTLEAGLYSPAGNEISLSDDARKVLLLACAHPNHNIIMIQRHLGGTNISAGGVTLVGKNDRREIARWEAAIEELASEALVKDMNYKGEIFEPTHKGFLEAERLSNQDRPEA